MDPNRPPPKITDLLVDWSNGSQEALETLMPLVYEELRRMAHRYMRNERTGQTLQTTALVHEAYLRLADHRRVEWKERAHFFAIAAKVMRRILVENSRSRGRAKRGGNAQKVSLEDGIVSLETVSANWKGDSQGQLLDMLALDQAMQKLEAVDSRKTKVVEMRFFAGMDNKEIAEVLGVAPNTVMRDWNFAEAWLRRELAA